MKPSYLNFDKKTYYWKDDVNYRENPECYHVGRGEQGVLICEPYKSEILPYWAFKNPEVATKSSKKILSLFRAYLKRNEFVGADLARKFLQMGFTRARRYANYAGGKKYDKDQDYALLERGTGSMEKAQAADIFYQAWQLAETTPRYNTLKKAWKLQYG